MTRLAALVALTLAAGPAVAGQPFFDWDRYHERRDACTEADQLIQRCARDNVCDDLALRQAQRRCHERR